MLILPSHTMLMLIISHPNPLPQPPKLSSAHLTPSADAQYQIVNRLARRIPASAYSSGAYRSARLLHRILPRRERIPRHACPLSARDAERRPRRWPRDMRVEGWRRDARSEEVVAR